jgi:hypothetical protein
MSWVGKKASCGCGVAAAEAGVMDVCMVDRVGMLDSLVNMVAKGEKEQRG